MEISRHDFTASGGATGQDAETANAAPDRVLYEALRRDEYCLVVAPPHLSKLVRVRAADRLREEGSRPVLVGKEAEPGKGEAAPGATDAARRAFALVVLPLSAMGTCLTPEEWYERLLAHLAGQLGLTEELAAFWRQEGRLSPLQRWMAALRDVVLPGLGVRGQGPEARGGVAARRSERGEGAPPLAPDPSPLAPGAQRLVIFVDEIDAVRGLPFSTDEFFSAIRECYNRRSQDPEFNRLTFCLLGEARLATLIRDPRTTWFNIGVRLEVAEPSDAEAGSPAPGERRSRSRAGVLLKRALDWICGEPYCCMGPLVGARSAAALL